MDGPSDGHSGLSLAWRCFDCGRLLLMLEPSAAPASCTDCGGSGFRSIGPPHDPRGTYRNAATKSLPWPGVERRKAPRL
jgi:hypothetical protein